MAVPNDHPTLAMLQAAIDARDERLRRFDETEAPLIHRKVKNLLENGVKHIKPGPYLLKYEGIPFDNDLPIGDHDENDDDEEHEGSTGDVEHTSPQHAEWAVVVDGEHIYIWEYLGPEWSDMIVSQADMHILHKLRVA